MGGGERGVGLPIFFSAFAEYGWIVWCCEVLFELFEAGWKIWEDAQRHATGRQPLNANSPTWNGLPKSVC